MMFLAGIFNFLSKDTQTLFKVMDGMKAAFMIIINK